MDTGKRSVVCVTISKKGEILLKVKVQPNSSKSGIEGIYGDSLKIKLNSPPVEGKANGELLKFLSKFLKVPKGNLEIISGKNSRIKTIKITGIDERELKEKYLKS